MDDFLLLGQTLAFTDNPLRCPWAACVRTERHGGLRVTGGIITALGPAEVLRAAHPALPVVDLGAALILPGFVDAHAHYPQTAMIASWGKRLIDWLDTYTFPEELRFADPDYAARSAARYFDLTLSHGTTTVCSYATVHPASVEAYFVEARRRGLRALAGKTCMDRNAPEGLRDTPQTAYDDSKRLLERWHGVDRLSYVITPRFSPTSSREQLAALGALYAEHPDCLMQTHISEQTDEIAWVAELFPEARDYLDTYEAAGLLGPTGLFGHAIHLTARERDRLAEVGAALVHCPTSNSFIGSGLFDMAGLASRCPVGLATDTGGGSSFSMLRTMAAAYEIAQLRGMALHPAQLLWLATAGSAEALRLGHRIGRLAVGMEADLVALDLASTPAIAQRAAEAEDLWEAVFPTIMMGDDRAVAGVWVAGAQVS
ncbi:guanine deaminase [Dinoroseobacter shibae DFL 12 = DSM 16493]|jgi:guanine deaminase|uniref:Guanine deaminase n=1 Tax=Dinoroseobacter shibae (strain DSM 16493 / NCIMB 14021 / DFL 12) TaxID=398580 RepID=A8LJ09_DINSH|nr:guanine deaminase [Dinoroseobacter shibae]ABV94504.1 guanine deaminase [Dinoroseobacter shibae DFL 12 = DSM 16493]URF45931.1 guanine deaminase [Dinoroseobacter shibae]URF50237.1 guanine deaminase [Dinoroseobacter shibae]